MFLFFSSLFTALIGGIFSWFFLKFFNQAKGLSVKNFVILQENLQNMQKQNDDQSSKILVLNEKILARDYEILNLKAINQKDFQENQLLIDKFSEEKRQNGGLQSIKILLEQQIEEQRNKISTLQQDLQSSLQEKSQLNSEISKLQANLIATKDEFSSLRKQFEIDATNIFKAKSQEIGEQNLKNIGSLLNPLGEELKNFKKKIEETYEKEVRERISLENVIKSLQEKTNEISTQANNLASALKGKAKIQGNWGEMILERILEQSGLISGKHYLREKTISGEEGKILRPDFQILLPDNRIIITDSKLSLSAFDRYCSTENKIEAEKFLQEHLSAIHSHIDILSAKKYDDLQGSLDFTFMFMPIEPAYLLAIQNDDELWNYAYQKRILLVSPTNLIACLKIIHDLWKRDDQGKNAQKIAEAGAKLYEKFVGFVDSMQMIGKNIDNAKNSYDKAMIQLSQGKGNLLRQAENLKELGIKSSKQIALELVDDEKEE